MTDPISDMLTRIRNAQAVNHKTAVVPYSRLKHNLAKILERRGLVNQVGTQGKKTRKVIEIELKYGKDNEPAITDLKRVSKPGKRVYIKGNAIKPVRQGYGLAIISTSQGLMTNGEAKKKNLGGELICEIW